MRRIFLMLICCCILNCYAQNNQCNGKQLVGSYEKIMLEQNFSLDAKIDTGAAMASLSATNIKFYQQSQQQWVSFDVYNPVTKQKINYKKPLLHYVHVLKREEEASAVDHTQKQYGSRPVVALDVCLANQKLQVNVNLIDRTNFQFPMLIGNATLRQYHLIVDPSGKYLSAAKCA